MKDKRKEAIRAAAEAHTNLTMFAAVVALLESGCVCGYSKTAQRVISICQAEQQKILREYDRQVARAMKADALTP